MRDTTCSVPDAVSRGRECAAPTNSSEIQNNVTSVSRGQTCPVCGWSKGFGHSASCTSGTESGSNRAREYLVDQLVITARHLADSHIFRKHVEYPFCQICLMSGLNGRPIAHLASCMVGRVLRSIEDLR